MRRRRRTEILIDGSRDIPARLARLVLDKYEVSTIEQSNNGLVMVKARESARKSLFYVGEMFVTECKVQLRHAVGLGIVKGHEPELAYQLAVIDAAYGAELEETKAWEAVLTAEEAAICRRRREQYARVLQTKVNFATMDDGRARGTDE